MTTSKEAVLAKLNEHVRTEHAVEAEKAARAGRQPPAEPVLLKPEQIEFPKWIHKGWKSSSKGGGHQEPVESRVIYSAKELETLGDGWSEEPPKTKVVDSAKR